MKVTYFALKPVQVMDDWRQPGDLVPEAADWPFLSAYLSQHVLQPILVATLPKKAQEELSRWEEDRQIVAMLEEEGVSENG